MPKTVFASVIMDHICWPGTPVLTTVKILFAFGKFLEFSTSKLLIFLSFKRGFKSLNLLTCVANRSSCTFDILQTSSPVLKLGLVIFFLVTDSILSVDGLLCFSGFCGELM